MLFAGAVVLASHLPRERTEILAAFVLFPLAVWPAVRFPMREVATFNVALAALVHRRRLVRARAVRERAATWPT